MDELERRLLRKRNVLLATLGLLSTMATGYGLRVLGFSDLRYGGWTAALALTLVVQALAWLVPHMGWDTRFRFDPHYIFVPMIAVLLLLNVYIFVAPDSRVHILMLWFVALLFMAGYAGFRAVALLGFAMAAGYLSAVALRHAYEGRTRDLADDAVLAFVFILINLFAGVVFDRLQRERHEMQALRRRLADHALTDALTGLPNRRRFDEALRAEITRTTRHGGIFCVAMLDVDNFKNYNDRQGHPAGDRVLRGLAEVLRTELRAGDLAARYGGEEFALLLVGAGCEEAVHVLDRLRRLVEVQPFEGREQQPGGRVTVSAGVAEFPGETRDEAALIGRADAALYRAKTAGRNRVMAADLVL